ncbi:MAG: ATP-binding protein [Lachnospiraceae bacterium]|nr:ATP-binding protein [Lachnospiraceae bacterium]
MALGRQKEFAKLNECISRGESSLTVLYGEHLTGISSLWQSFAKEKNAVVFSCVPSSSEEQAYLWMRFMKGNLSESATNLSYFDVFSEIKSNSENEKCVIFTDFHFAIEARGLFLTELDRFLKSMMPGEHIHFIFVSERTDWVENDFAVTAKSFGVKISNYIKVSPLSFVDVVCSLNTRDFDLILKMYSLFGGYFDALDQFDLSQSIDENIIDHFIRPDGAFRHYGTDMIRCELREPSVYATILASLAEGRNKLNDLFLHTGFSRAKLSVYLKNLAALGLVEKVKSFDTPGTENTKKGVYRIVNPMVKFYFTFIYPNECAIHNMDEEEFYQTYIADYLDAYCMLTFPAICEEFLILANERDMLPIHFTKYGQWVGKSGTIDLIAQNKERDFLFSFCKPSRGELTYDEFLDRLSTTKETHLVPDYFAVFSLDGFDSKFLDDFSERENVYLFDREDLC